MNTYKQTIAPERDATPSLRSSQTPMTTKLKYVAVTLPAAILVALV